MRNGKKSIPSYAYLGTPSESAYNGDLINLKLTNGTATDSHNWTPKLDYFAYGDEIIERSDNAVDAWAFQEGTLKALFDSGTSYIGLPKEVLDKVLKQIENDIGKDIKWYDDQNIYEIEGECGAFFD